MKTRDVACAGAFVALALLLSTQTDTGEESLFAGSFDPMLYPAILLCLLGAMSVLLALRGLLDRTRRPGRAHAEPQSDDSKPADWPIWTRRTLGVAATLVLYALLLDTLGFFVVSVCACAAIAFLLGYRNPLGLAAFSLTAVALVRLAYQNLLRIPLPAGSLF